MQASAKLMVTLKIAKFISLSIITVSLTESGLDKNLQSDSEDDI